MLTNEIFREVKRSVDIKQTMEGERGSGGQKRQVKAVKSEGWREKD